MDIEFFHVDAFTTKPFGGNAAAVVILQSESQFNKDELLHTIAKEFNLPATTFLFSSSSNAYKIKWFTPLRRIPLCGHGTLAASHILFNKHPALDLIQYDSGPAGNLTAARAKEDSIQLEFPACNLVQMQDVGQQLTKELENDLERLLASAFSQPAQFTFIGRGDSGSYVDMMVAELPENYPLKAVTIDHSKLVSLFPTIRGITFTTRSSADNTCHIHSRCFYTLLELGEDQVTGSAHCMIAPYWFRKLGLANDAELVAAQVSQRGGIMALEWKQDEMRCLIRSSAVTIAKGTMRIE